MSCRRSTGRKRAELIAGNTDKAMHIWPIGSNDSSIPISPGRTHPAVRAAYQSLDNDFLKTFFEEVLDQNDVVINRELSRLVVLPPFEDTESSQQYVAELLMRLEFHAQRH